MVKYHSYRAGSSSRVPIPKTVGRKRKRRTTKYGEPIRRFNKKEYRLQNKFAYKKDAKDYKKRVKEKGYLARITPFKGGHKLWVKDTPKSRKWEKEVMGKKQFDTSTGKGLYTAKGFYDIKKKKGQKPSIKQKGKITIVKYKKR